MSDRRTAPHWQTHPAPAHFTAGHGPALTPLPRLDAVAVQAHLREAGVTVHHAARMPTPRDGRQVVVVFLDGTAEQVELARDSAKRLPGVLDVIFSGYNKAVMYVIATPAQFGPEQHPRAP